MSELQEENLLMPESGKQSVKQRHRSWPCDAHRPKADEILQWREGDEDAVDKGVDKKQQEKLVVGETYTVVHPNNTATSFSSNSSITVVHIK